MQFKEEAKAAWAELLVGKGLGTRRAFAYDGVHKLQCWWILPVLGCVWAGYVGAADSAGAQAR